jgi:DNA invertase Pin-like site-specific DNA recombinase
MGKLLPYHLSRQALVYVRQSTTAQIHDHAESTKRQYALVQRAHALGWDPQAIEVIDEDLGRSGTTVEGRTGFARLARAVAEGLVGAILAVEVSRLARSSVDWQRLMSLCAVTQVLVVDEVTIYDPQDPDDKLLLDLKGSLSEAELHWMGLRLNGARRAKARRGELHFIAPTGYIWTERGFQMDPDEAVQGAVRLAFARFALEPSACAVVRWARRQGILFPTRVSFRDGTSEVQWKPLGQSRFNDMLRNPIYAGAYVYGRRPAQRVVQDGEIRVVRASTMDPKEWAVYIKDAHPAYIGWADFLANQEKLQRNMARLNTMQRGAPREGAALLSGLLVCGRCGRRMSPAYLGSRSPGGWTYHCRGERDTGGQLCWTTPGAALDRAVEELFLSTFAPPELELCLAVEREIEAQAEALKRQWSARLEQAEYEAHRAERRYKAVEPENRVVARTLEKEWEERLRELEEVERRYAQARKEKQVELDEQDRMRIRALARDLPMVWHAPTTPVADRKAMLRLAIEAVSAMPVESPQRATELGVQWKSQTVTRLTVPRPSRKERTRTPPSVVELVRELVAEGIHDGEIAQCLNEADVKTGKGKPWDIWAVRWVRQRNQIEKVAPDQPRRPVCPEQHPDGSYSVRGAARRLGTSEEVIRTWLKRGLLQSHRGRHPDYPEAVLWIRIDDETAERLDNLPRRRTRLPLGQRL